MPEQILRGRGLRKEFGSGHTRVVAVDDMSVEVAKGEVVLVVGPSGSGKTTLLSMMGGLLTPTDGEVFIDGDGITGKPPGYLSEVRRRYVGFVFQGFNLLRSLTAIENVQVALNLNGVRGKAAKERAGAMLLELDLAGRLDYYPVDMSQGERQRVCIARALVNHPKIVLADEPTGNLDSRTGHKVAELLRDLASGLGAAVVIVTHDIRLAGIADRVLQVEDGRLVDENPRW